ncbi:MAG TPA: DUF1877 family protein [Planctomycetota bacterium]|jgi:hypothetical protein|nr:DUF1877 family protein [Planctomycetota bacterium]
MSRARGVHFAIVPSEAQRLLDAEGDDAVREVLEDFEARPEAAPRLDLGTVWDPIHRCLSNGTLFYDEGEYPLNHAVLGGRHLYSGDERVVSFVEAGQVPEVARALQGVSEDWFRERYQEIDPDDYDGPYGEEDLRRAWEAFRDLRRFFARAAEEGRAVVFTAA